MLGCVGFAHAADTIYRSPVPAGGNPAVFAAPQPDGWYESVQRKFDRFSGKHFDIVFDGDSITNRWESTGRSVWEAYYAGNAADFGIEGDRVENVLWRLGKGQVDGIDPKVVVLLVGTNNIARDTANQIADGIKLLVSEYEKRCPHARIILMGVFPRDADPNGAGRRKAAAINAQIAALHDGKQIFYVDIASRLLGPNGSLEPEMMPDFLHPGPRGYRLWAEAIQPIVSRFVPPTNRPSVAATASSPVAANTTVITFSQLYSTPGAAPQQGEIPASYQPLLAAPVPSALADGKDLGVSIIWDHALCSNPQANDGVRDHTGDEQSADKSLGGGVMFGTGRFAMTFSGPVEVPSLYWTYYEGGNSVGSISAYRKASDPLPFATVTLSYRQEQGYAWQQETGFRGQRISKLVFDPGKGSGSDAPALNIDDITIRVEPETKP